MDSKYLFKHVYGGLIGQALGDAFAMPAYFRPQDTWDSYDGWINKFFPGPSDHPVHAGLEPGEVTDDTQQAMSIIKEILVTKKIDVNIAAKAITNWYDAIDGDNNAHVGPSTRKACSQLKSGIDPHESGVMGDTNGSAMRISPIGLINPGNIQQAILDTIVICTPTHFTSIAISGACAVASAVANAMLPHATIQSIIENGKIGADEGRKYGNVWLGASISKRIDLAIQIVEKENDVYEKIIDLYDIIGSTLSPSESVPSAFGIFALAEGDPMTCARYAAALSGDADTVAAMACAIAGAWKGIDSIPTDIKNTIEKVNKDYNFYETAKGIVQFIEERNA
ncbi:MAG: hypothetical protein GYA18_12490 [Chloroflexi bacterium]|nr:hypothetical protein [Chloroflexota bacterium]